MKTLLGFGIVVIATAGIYLLGRATSLLLRTGPPPDPEAAWYWILGLLPVGAGWAIYAISVRVGELLP